MSSVSELLPDLLPDGVVGVELRGDREVPLFESERRALGRAVEKRRREFVSGRACAREAMAQLGLPPSPVGSGAHGEPLWPPGVVGSITHCSGYRGCAVGKADRFSAIGIDAERDAPLDGDVWRTIARRAERPLRDRGLDAVLFSAKEAVYKAIFPLSRARLDFRDAEVAIGSGGAFEAFLDGPPTVAGRLAGRWSRGGGVVVATVVLPSHERLD